MSELRGRDIVCFSNDWDGDPLSKTHLMKLLARDNRVLWVSSIGNRAPRANGRDLRRIADKLRQAAQGLRQRAPNIHVLNPLAIPAYRGPALHANRALLAAQVRLAMARLRFKRPVTWAFLPAAAVVAGSLGEERVVYHVVDEFGAFTGAGPAIAALERQLLDRADLVIASSERLRDAKARHNPRTVLVRHGVDHRHFARALDSALPEAPELARLPRPRVGFMGLLADWVDLKLVRAVAQALPHASVVLVGRVDCDVSPLLGLANVYLVGRRPYAELPAWCKGFDVALLPFKINELTLAANPLKVREYLAAGLPVVATPLPEVAALVQCRIALGAEFVRQVEKALEDQPGPRPERSRAVEGESWEHKADEVRKAFALI